VCHSDLHWRAATGPFAPVVLGHEGAGVVLEVGAEVTRITPGDHVVFCWAPPCGACPLCTAGREVLCDRLDKTTFRNKLPSGATRLRARGQDVAHFLSTACFALHAVIDQAGAVVVDSDTSFEALATLGCAVVTGVGAVTTAAKVPAGASVVVIGAGGVGLNVVQGAVISGARKIVAVDRGQAPLAFARQFGATDTAEASSNLGDAIRDLAGGGGADFVFDTVGTPETLAAALTGTRKGGAVVVTGLSRLDAVASLPMFPCHAGQAGGWISLWIRVPHRHIARLVGWCGGPAQASRSWSAECPADGRERGTRRTGLRRGRTGRDSARKGLR
jgi:S-(hydroxymethyl)glutathione dehydrogenase/alcohol dehydrogenase